MDARQPNSGLLDVDLSRRTIAVSTDQAKDFQYDQRFVSKSAAQRSFESDLTWISSTMHSSIDKMWEASRCLLGTSMKEVVVVARKDYHSVPGEFDENKAFLAKQKPRTSTPLAAEMETSLTESNAAGFLPRPGTLLAELELRKALRGTSATVRGTLDLAGVYASHEEHCAASYPPIRNSGTLHVGQSPGTICSKVTIRPDECGSVLNKDRSLDPPMTLNEPKSTVGTKVFLDQVVTNRILEWRNDVDRSLAVEKHHEARAPSVGLHNIGSFSMY